MLHLVIFFWGEIVIIEHGDNTISVVNCNIFYKFGEQAMNVHLKSLRLTYKFHKINCLYASLVHLHTIKRTHTNCKQALPPHHCPSDTIANKWVRMHMLSAAHIHCLCETENSNMTNKRGCVLSIHIWDQTLAKVFRAKPDLQQYTLSTAFGILLKILGGMGGPGKLMVSAPYPGSSLFKLSN